MLKMQIRNWASLTLGISLSLVSAHSQATTVSFWDTVLYWPGRCN